MSSITVRYWAAAKEAASTAEETFDVETLAGALDAVHAKHGDDSRLAAVLKRSSFLVDGRPANRLPAESVRLADGAVVEVLPAFAGG
jgi:molybdopterin synthase sulfur carrier subunit